MQTADAESGDPREVISFNKGWLFHRGGGLGPECIGFGNHGFTADETRLWQKVGNHGISKPENTVVDAWRKVDLPHDFVIEGEFTNKAHFTNGSLAGDEAWYVRKFDLPEQDRGRRIKVEFDGVYRNCSLFFNGQFVGRHLSGYTSFGFDLTDLCRFGKPNSLAVHVDAVENELWSYEGGGIYRGVRLIKTDPLHIPQWGVFVRTGGADDPGRVDLEVSVRNDSAEAAEFDVKVAILGPDCKGGPGATVPGRVEAFSTVVLRHTLQVKSPRLWDVDQPVLYVMELMIERPDRITDTWCQLFGFRYFHFDPDTGFHLNGRSLKLKGVCCHQDHAAVGSAVPPALQMWRVRRLKEMGCNAIRTSHNPPDPALLDACDRLGMMVMDEIRLPGTSGDLLADFESLVLRDRNHPSVILWSLGNEEMAIQETEWGVEIFRRLQHLAHRLDPSRPATYAMNCEWLKIAAFHNDKDFRFDVFGANYRSGLGGECYDRFHEAYPDWPLVGAETWGGGATRGLYESDIGGAQSVSLMNHYLNRDSVWGDKPDFRFVSAYGNWRTAWGASLEDVWRDCATRPFMAGTFLWTGFDYRGETTPYRWPAVVTRFGLLDLCGFNKEIAHYLRAWWRPRDPHVFLMPHWNWEGQEGSPIDVRCYSNAAEVELFLNGASLGRKVMIENGRLDWRVPYECGELKAVGYGKDGREIGVHRRRTAKAPAAIVLSSGFGWVKGLDEEFVIAVDAAIVDADGELCPRSTNLVEFAVEGQAEILGVGNGNPLSHEPDKASRRAAFNGLCQIILKTNQIDAVARLEAKSAGLPSQAFQLSKGKI
jgi:beta-galactosidase